MANFVSDYGEDFKTISIEEPLLLTGQTQFTPKETYQLNKMVFKNKIPPLPLEFEYGYAITCHKAQGSAWDNVLIVEEKFPGGSFFSPVNFPELSKGRPTSPLVVPT